MKRKGILIIPLMLLIGSFVLWQLPRSEGILPKSEILIHHSDAPLLSAPKLFYSDLSYEKVHRFRLTHEGLVRDDTAYTPYTEGFIPTSLYNKLMEILEKSLSLNTRTFHDYYSDDTVAIVAFTGDLHALYRIDLIKETASPLSFDPSQNLGSMYVSHMQRVGDTLVVLGGEANAHASLIYTINLLDGTVLSAKRLMNAPHTLHEDDFAILEDGTCLFTGVGGVQVYNPFTDEESFFALDFDSTQVLSYGDTGIIFGEVEDGLRIVTPHLDTLLPLPAVVPRIVDLYVKEDYLFLALYDAANGRFSNYLSVYDLNTGKWVYALGLEPLDDEALLFIQE